MRVSILVLTACVASLNASPGVFAEKPPLEIVRTRWADVPREEQGWPVLLEALALRDRSEPEGADSPDRSAFRAGDAEWWAGAEAWLGRNAAYIAKVKELSKKRVLAYPITDGFDADTAAVFDVTPGEPSERPMLLWAQLPHLGEYRRISRGLVIESHAAWIAGDFGRWGEAVHAQLGLAEQLCREWSDIDVMIGISIADRACGEIRRRLGGEGDGVSEDVLRGLGARLAAFGSGRPIRIPLSSRLVATDYLKRAYGDEGGAESRITDAGFDRLIAEIDGLADLIAELAADKPPEKREPVGVDDASKSVLRGSVGTLGEVTRELERLAPIWRACVDRPLWEGACPAAGSGWRGRDSARYLPLSMFVPDVKKLRSIQAASEISMSASVIAVASRRYALHHGKYPADLDALVPEFLERVPRDVFADQPVLYALREGVPLTYMRGVDQDDDRGVPMGSGNPPFPRGEWMRVPPAERASGDVVLWPWPKGD